MTGAEEDLPPETHLVTEAEYKFGVGPILVHSVEIIAETLFDNELWFHVDASVANGDWQRHGGFVRREIYLKAVERRVRRPPWTSA